MTNRGRKSDDMGTRKAFTKQERGNIGGKKGREPTPQKWETEGAWIYQDGKDACEIVLGHMAKIDPEDVEEGNETTLESEEAGIRKWTKERAIRMMGPREEEEIKEEGKSKIESKGSSKMKDTQMSGVAWGAKNRFGD